MDVVVLRFYSLKRQASCQLRIIRTAAVLVESGTEPTPGFTHTRDAAGRRKARHLSTAARPAEADENEKGQGKGRKAGAPTLRGGLKLLLQRGEAKILSTTAMPIREPDLAEVCLIRANELYPRASVITVDRDDFRA